MASPKVEGRVLLPDAVQPKHYKICLEPDLSRFNFKGSETITLQVHEATDEISLHAKELAVDHDSVQFKPKDGNEIKPEEVRYNLSESVLTFKFPEVLPVGEGFLDIDFVGCLNDQMAGFYRSSYKDIQGNSKIMASTQFQAIDARRAFPCWDEPAQKVVFAITLIVDAGLTAFSNMPEKSVKSVDNGLRTELVFMDTPKMSTYLVAFVVGEFDFLQRRTEHGVLVRVYVPPGRSADADFSLSVATKALDYYDDYFGIPYPLPKLDMAAIPDFACGAMENWGLVTYREVDLLIAAGASNAQKQRVTTIVTHELAHQWFGNLVTMGWWDDLWLNEGFATWMENNAADIIFPNFYMWDQFIAESQAAALRLDALRSSHPVQVPIYHAEEADEVFDCISYEKGSSVIRMAHAYLGAEAFQKGLQDYFQKHKYSNTETLDLWAAWSAASGKPVQEFMGSWTEQMGFPLLTVDSFIVNGTEATIVLEQNWFLADGSEVLPEEEKLWKIPLICCSGAGTAAMELMQEKTHKMNVRLKDANDFVKINAGQHVPMRVLYTLEAQQRLEMAIANGMLPVADRAGLVLDAYALAKAGMLGAEAVIRLLTAFKSDTSYVVWEAVATALYGFNRILKAGATDVIYEKFRIFVANLIADASAAMGWEKRELDGHLDGLLRQTFIFMQARYGSGEIVKAEAKKRWDAFLKGDTSALPDDIKVPVFQIMLRTGGMQEFEEIRQVFARAQTNLEQCKVYHSIGHVADLAKKKEVLMWSLSGEVKPQDITYPISSVSESSKAAILLTWQFFKDNFDEISKLCSPSSMMDEMIDCCAGNFSTAEDANDVEAFFKEHPLPQNVRKISQVLESVRTNGAFLTRILGTRLNEESFWDEVTK